MGKNRGIFKALFEKPKDIGYRFGFIAILLIVITAMFPAFISIGASTPQLVSFQAMFLTGLVGSMFFAMMLRNMSKTRASGGDIFSAQNISKQIGVLMLAVMAGLVMIVANSALYGSMGGNVLLASTWGTIDPTAFYLGLLAGVSEELFFRGFLGTFLRIVSPNLMLAVITTAAIFSLFHWFAYQTFTAFVILFVLGIILGLIHEFTNDIGAPMLAHVLNNSFAMLPAVLLVIMANSGILILLVAIFVLVRVFRGVGRGKIGGIKLG